MIRYYPFITHFNGRLPIFQVLFKSVLWTTHGDTYGNFLNVVKGEVEVPFKNEVRVGLLGRCFGFGVAVDAELKEEVKSALKIPKKSR